MDKPLTPTSAPPPAPEAAPSCAIDMADTPRDAGFKQAPTPRNEKAPVDFGYVGIDSILEQMRRKAMRQGFEFNIMVVGECPAPSHVPGCVFSSVTWEELAWCGVTWCVGDMCVWKERVCVSCVVCVS